MKEIAEPGKYFVLLDRHSGKDEYEIVVGDTVFATGDHLVLIVKSEEASDVLEEFGNVIE